MNVSSVKNLNGETFSAVQDADLTTVIQTNSGNWNDISAYQNASSTYITAINIPESADWEDTTDVVQTNSASWGSGSTPTYDYTDNDLISAIDTSGLYSTSAGTAKALINGGRLGTDVYAVTGDTLMILNPNTTPFGNTSGIYSPLYYAQGACMTYGSSAGNTQYFGGFFKGNEWYVSNATAGQALRGETHGSRGVHISGATTYGYSFDLSVYDVRGKNDTANGYNWKLERSCVSGKGVDGGWRYGPPEDTLLRSVSSSEVNTYVQNNSATIDDVNTTYQNASGTYLQEVSHDNTLSGNGTVNSPLGVVNPLPYPMEIVSTSSEATGTNILYVVTGAGA